MAEDWRTAYGRVKMELDEYKETIVPALMERVQELEQQWIPVRERLPSNGEKVLVFWATPYGRYYDIVRFARCLEDVDDLDFEGQKHGGFYSYDSEYGYYETSDVTHWMPLPEAPKEEEL